jgi:hypothetical protein
MKMEIPVIAEAAGVLSSVRSRRVTPSTRTA